MRGPQSLFGKQGRLHSRVEKRLCSSERLSLFLDYDGTLTPIAPTPEQAVLSARALELLKKLTRVPGLSLAIVSGRPLAQILRMIPRMSITIAANHGLQIADRGGVWTHPVALHCVPALAVVRASLKRKLRRVAGVRLENKGVVLAIHLRQVEPGMAAVVRMAVREVTKSFMGTLRVTTGKKVLEIRPAVDWGKGEAILRLSASPGRGQTLPVFIGDDKTDEDGFAALEEAGLTIRVGRSQRTKAHYYVSDVDQVLKFLEAIVRFARH